MSSDKDNINLMPEDLRKMEQDVLSKQNIQSAPNALSQPNKKQVLLDAELSGSSGDSWLQKTFSPEQANPVPVAEKVAEAPSPLLNKEETSGFQLNEQKVAGEFHQPEKIVRARFMDEESGVDLVPQLSKVKSWKQISSLMILALVASLGVVVVFYFGLLTWDGRLKALSSALREDIIETEKSLLTFQDSVQRINDTGKEIERVYDLLNKHIYWTNFFTLLEKYTLAEVTFAGFAAANNGALTLNATAPDFQSMAKQLKILQTEEAKEFVSSVDISGGTQAETGVNFSMSLVLNPNLFYYQTDK